MAVTIRGSGQVPVQIVTATLTSAFTFASTAPSWVDITGLSVTITPSNSLNRILVMFNIHGTTPNLGYVAINRNGTFIGIGDVSSNRVRTTVGNLNQAGGANQYFNFGMNFLDSPSTTSAVTYKLQGACETSNTVFVNRTNSDVDSNTGSRAISTITVMEIAYA